MISRRALLGQDLVAAVAVKSHRGRAYQHAGFGVHFSECRYQGAGGVDATGAQKFFARVRPATTGDGGSAQIHHCFRADSGPAETARFRIPRHIKCSGCPAR